MCGIAGIVQAEGRAPVERATLQAMAGVLRHRGPDGWGLYRDPHVGLAHARLAIVDIAGGDQPLGNHDGTVWVSFNGEVFNHVELRGELAARGHRFRTRSDTEVIVQAYEEWGEGAWRRFNGQFAFALWDRRAGRAGRLWLVRDRLGILPLLYTVTGDRLVFASEAKAIFADGSTVPSVDPTGVTEVFRRWSAPGPGTVFEGIRSVRPGTALAVDVAAARDRPVDPPRLPSARAGQQGSSPQGGPALRLHEQVWWEADLAADPDVAGLSLDDAATALGERLGDAVRLRLRADVPVGAYLSGGLDSSVVASLVEQGDSPLETFAVRFDEPAFDETAEQRRMAGLLGTRHHEIVCDGATIADALADVVWHCETPLLRTAPVPLFLLSGLVRQAGMKVVLTGEGADELFAGYGVFKEDAVRRFWARRPDSEVRPALMARLHPEVAASGARGTDLWARFFGRGLTETGDPFYAHRIRWRNTAWAQRLLSLDLRAAGRSAGPDGDPDGDDDGDAALAARRPAGWEGWPPLARAQWSEIATFMTPYLLSCQGDRVAMAHGVEVRYPFLDPEVVGWAFGLPTRLKMPGLRDKVALRRLASRTLPPEIWRRPKQPYRAPMTTPLFGPDAPDQVRDLLSPAAVEQFGLLDPAPTAKLLARALARGGRMGGEREEMALVGALTLQILGQHYLVDLPGHIAAAGRALDGVSPTVDVLIGVDPHGAADAASRSPGPPAGTARPELGVEVGR
jgi:asparagine synthase (glutamine-hydrolysing)